MGLRFMMVNMIVVATSAAISATMPVPAAALRVVGPNLRRLLSHSPAERLMLRLHASLQRCCRVDSGLLAPLLGVSNAQPLQRRVGWLGWCGICIVGQVNVIGLIAK